MKNYILGGGTVYFLENTILSPGEKVKRIRGYLGSKQSEITGGRVTRNLISYIENGKTKLVRDTAEIIAENMLKEATEKKIPLKITAEYLMWDKETQARNLLEKYASELVSNITKDKNFDRVLEQAEDILSSWDIKDKKAEIDEIVGDYFYNKNLFVKSNINYVKALENYIIVSDNIKIAEVYSKLGRNKIILKDYQEGIYYNQRSKLILDENGIDDTKIYNSILYNNALAYKNLDRYEDCLENLNSLEKTFENLSKSEQLNILLLKGNVRLSQGDYEAAEDVFDRIIKDCDEDEGELKASAYFSLSKIYLEKHDCVTKAMECLLECRDIQLETKSYNLVDTYLTLAKCYDSIDENGKKNMYISSALEEAKQWNNHILFVDIYKEILNLYMNKDEVVFAY